MDGINIEVTIISLVKQFFSNRDWIERRSIELLKAKLSYWKDVAVGSKYLDATGRYFSERETSTRGRE